MDRVVAGKLLKQAIRESTEEEGRDCSWMMLRLVDLVVEYEREECAKMFDNAPKLVPFGKGKDGGCIMCGFNSEKAAAAIRSRT